MLKEREERRERERESKDKIKQLQVKEKDDHRMHTFSQMRRKKKRRKKRRRPGRHGSIFCDCVFSVLFAWSKEQSKSVRRPFYLCLFLTLQTEKQFSQLE